MENSFFITTPKEVKITIERLHICIWEFEVGSSLIEVGFEIDKESVKSLEKLNLLLYMPWLKGSEKIQDLFPKLKDANNSRFIFNDSITGTKYLVENSNDLGTTHEFSGRGRLCILPITSTTQDKFINITIDLHDYQLLQEDEKANVYCRVSMEPHMSYLSTHKRGIGKYTVIYDIKVNERRNIPLGIERSFSDKNLCKINNCFLFNIIPNKYDIVFFESSHLKSVRALEYQSFKQYLDDERIKANEMIVVFSKKTVNSKEIIESFSFFYIFSKETIGATQFMVAIVLNILCGLLFFIASFRHPPATSVKSFWCSLLELPIEIYFAIIIMVLLSVYLFFLPFGRKRR